jgi:hypothetical protein
MNEATTPVSTNPVSAEQDIRAFLEQHRQGSCAACHALFDPYGMALENFDGIGQWRTTYPSGTAIDPTATLTDGSMLNGPQSVIDALSADPRLTSCVTQKLFVYGLGRGIAPVVAPATESTDAPYLRAVTQAWTTGGMPTLTRLAQQLVLSAPFRVRHGEATN